MCFPYILWGKSSLGLVESSFLLPIMGRALMKAIKKEVVPCLEGKPSL